MSSNSVAALRALLASSSVAAPALLSAVDSGGTSFSVGAGGGGDCHLSPRPWPRPPIRWACLYLELVITGLIGSSNVICGVFNCGVPLHRTKRATVIELTGYICRESPKSGAYLSPNLFLGELPESIVAFVISQARPPAAFCTLFAILSWPKKERRNCIHIKWVLVT